MVFLIHLYIRFFIFLQAKFYGLPFQRQVQLTSTPKESSNAYTFVLTLLEILNFELKKYLGMPFYGYACLFSEKTDSEHLKH